MMLDKELIAKLQQTVFNMLNYANMYVLVLDEKMTIKFANDCLEKDLGFKEQGESIGRCWLDFIVEEERKTITIVHGVLSKGESKKYSEFQNDIKSIDGEIHHVHWFNCHINSDYNWTFSFGIRKEPVPEITAESIRGYFRDIIQKDRTMIESIKDTITFKERIIDSCEPEL